MTIDQEIIANKIIQAHKDNNEQFHWNTTSTVFPEYLGSFNDIFDELIDKGLIKEYSYRSTQLTNSGRSFTTFEKERIEAAERKQINDGKDFYGLLQNKFIYKWRYFPYFVSGVTFAFSIYSYFNPRNATPNLQPLQKEIEVLTKRVNEIDSMFRSDSLSKKSKK